MFSGGIEIPRKILVNCYRMYPDSRWLSGYICFWRACEIIFNFLSGRVNFPFGRLFSIRNSFFKSG